MIGTLDDSINRLTTVVFPVPLGPERTTIRGPAEPVGCPPVIHCPLHHSRPVAPPIIRCFEGFPGFFQPPPSFQRHDEQSSRCSLSNRSCSPLEPFPASES